MSRFARKPKLYVFAPYRYDVLPFMMILGWGRGGKHTALYFCPPPALFLATFIFLRAQTTTVTIHPSQSELVL